MSIHDRPDVLLLDERPLIVLPSLAAKVGVTEAIILQQIHWASHHWRTVEEDDGEKWVRAALKVWEAEFPWCPSSTLREKIGRLESEGLLLKRRSSTGNMYRVNYDALGAESQQFDDHPSAESQQSDCQIPALASAESQQSPLYIEKDQKKDQGKDQARDALDDVDDVWNHYVEVMRPRTVDLPPQERKVIREALKVASADELKHAISKCSRSPFHMGVNDRHRKYNRLTQIIRGRQGKETTRERIDFWLDMETPDGSSSAKIPQSARFALDLSGMDPVTVGTVRHRRQTVRAMYENPNDEYAQRVGSEFEQWLREKIGHKPIIVDGRVTGWDYA